MSNYIDLVLVERDEKNHWLCTAPAFSYLSSGDDVVLEGSPDCLMSVIGCITLDTESDVFPFIETLCEFMCGCSSFPRIRGKVLYHTFNYKGDSDEQGESDRSND